MFKNITITNQIHSGSGFAVTEDMEGVFVPSHVMEAWRLQVGGVYPAKLGQNDSSRAEQNPYRVLGIAAPATVHPAPRAEAPVQLALDLEPEPEPAPPAIDLTATLRDIIRAGGVWSLAALYEAVHGQRPDGAKTKEYQAVSNHVQALHDRGDIAIALVYSKPDQQKAGLALYAASVSEFRRVGDMS